MIRNAHSAAQPHTPVYDLVRNDTGPGAGRAGGAGARRCGGAAGPANPARAHATRPTSITPNPHAPRGTKDSSAADAVRHGLRGVQMRRVTASDLSCAVRQGGEGRNRSRSTAVAPVAVRAH